MTTLADHIATAREVVEALRQAARYFRASTHGGVFDDKAAVAEREANAIEALIDKVESKDAK